MARDGRMRTKPARPAITAVFACACLFWAACAASYSAGRLLGFERCLAGSVAALAVGLLACAVCLVMRKRTVCLAAAFLCVGACLGFGAAASCHADVQVAVQSDFADVEIELIGDTKAAATGECGFARVTLASGRQAVVYVDFGDVDPLLHGDRVLASGSFSSPAWEKDAYLWQNGAIGRLRVRSVCALERDGPLAALQAMRSRAIAAIGSDDDARALMQALACGYRHDIAGSALYADFQRSGLAHLVAVSGAHLVIVTSLAAAALRALRVPRRVTIAILIGLMASYLVLSGMPVSAVRATLMSSVGILALIGRRRPSAMNALGIGMFAIVGTSPASAVSVSFALSALSTAGIVLFAPLVEFWLSRTPLVRLPFATSALSLTFAANALSQLFACSIFHQLPLISPLANVVCALLFPFACGVGLIAGLVASIVPALTPGAGIASLVSGLLAQVVGVLSAAPIASVPVSIETLPALALSVALAAVLWAAWPTLKARAVVPVAAASLVAIFLALFAVAQEDGITMLDVGQGDAFLVRSRGATLLIDTGNRDAQLIDQLARCAVVKLDSVLITHGDDDHCGSLDALERAVRVDRVILLADTAAGETQGAGQLVAQAERTAADIAPVRAGDAFAIGAFTAHVVGPRQLTDDGGNADSICLVLDYDGDADGEVDFRALFTGDAEREQVEELLKARAVGDIDLLKVGHHGSRNALTSEQAAALAPEIALIGVGAGNRYGHPAPETLAILEEAGCAVFRSDVDGQVKCSFTPQSIAVSLQ